MPAADPTAWPGPATANHFCLTDAHEFCELLATPECTFANLVLSSCLPASQEEKPWLKHFGKLKLLHKETKRINKFIEGAFEKIDPEIWE